MAASDDFQFTVPYVSDDLPGPLPTEDQIQNPDQVLAEVGLRKVVRIGEHYVVKYGASAEEIEVEAAAMMLVQKATSINSPKLYAIYELNFEEALAIVMEFIPGSPLSEVWPCLSGAHKKQVCLDLKGQIDQLRSLPSLGYFGGVGKRQMPDSIFWIGKKDLRVNGPFDSEDELNNAMVAKTLLVDQTWSHRGPERAQFYQRMLPSVLQNHAPVFTHGDLQRTNIIIQSRSGRDLPLTKNASNYDLQATDLRMFLVDWEKAGWYPNYWEYCSASWAFRFDDDWPEHFEKVVDAWPFEYAWLHILRNELF